MKPAIRIKNLKKEYGSLKALKGINFDVNEGELFGFLGPNGAGKTTTINILTGIANLTDGEIEIFGNNTVKNYREARALIGLAPQEFNFDPFLTVYECIIYQGGYYGIDNKTIIKRTEKLLKEFDLWHKRDNKIKELSGGMKRRLTIVRSLIHDPKIVILDEPTSGVDVELRRKLWKLFTDLKKKGKTIFLTTHYIEEAEKLCDRIAVINKGKIIALDKKEVMIEKFAKYTLTIMVKNLKMIPKRLKRYNVTKQNNTLIFFEHKDKLARILDDLKKEKVTIVDVSIDRDNLEDIFVELTK